MKASTPKQEIQRDARHIELVGDSPELVSFALLRSIIQLEAQQSPQTSFDKDWLLATYAECLSVVRGDSPKK